MYNEYRILGPYNRPDGRMHMVLVHKETGAKTTVSYPKYRMECILERYLDEGEEVHHKDEIISNNSDDNFEIRKKGEHQRYHSRKVSKFIAEMWKCYNCGKEFLANSNQVRERHYNLKRNKSKTGPFCSKSCSGKINN